MSEQKRLYNIRKNKYIDFKVNGRLFPSWILANFKKYKLPEIIKKAGDDPCNVKIKDELRDYQVFLSKYMDFKTPYRNILVYHGLGSGKTATAINIYNVLYNYTPGWNVFILIKASLKQTWLSELQKWLSKDEYDFRYKNIVFINYDSPFADKDFLNAIKNVDSSKKSMYIIEEVHNFIRNVYSNISSTSGKRAQTIYDYIIQDKTENPDTRVILLSGTPAINKPFELSLLFNLLRPGIFPKSENEFNHLFITNANYETINKNNLNLFQRRIMGLVTFYIGATPDFYASKTFHYVDVPMSSYQEDIYSHFEEIEEKIARSARFKGSKGSQMYMSYTRQASNFVFPHISQRITGEERPRPNKFMVTEREALKLSEGKAGVSEFKADKGTDKFMNVNQYIKAMELFITSFDSYLASKVEADKKKKHVIVDDLKTYTEKYDGDFQRFYKEEKTKSELFDAMYVSSPKMLNIIFNIMRSPGPVLVYSNYVLMEGVEVFKIYLKYFGFYSYMVHKKLDETKVGYVEFHGGIKEMKDRQAGMNAFNDSANKHGELLKIILISPAGSEGLSLYNVRQVHIMEPYWNEVRITQMIGRAVRQCSHKDLKVEDRHVDIYRYKAVRTKINKVTTDQHIEDVARSKDTLIQSFLNAMKQVAIDCVLNKNHTALVEDVKCFQFNEQSLFSKHIGPAYKDDIYDDMRLEDGLNSTKSMTVKIKVMKIRAVKLLIAPAEERAETESEDQDQGRGRDKDQDKDQMADSSGEMYSKADDYWYDPKSGTVYDYELYYPIGKISVGDDNIPVKIDKDTYVIDRVIPIPMIAD